MAPDESRPGEENPDAAAGEADERLDAGELRPGQEPLTPEEKERFLAQARTEGRTLTSEEMYALFGPPPEAQEQRPVYEDVMPQEAARLTPDQVAALQENFFPELAAGEVAATPGLPPAPPLVVGVIFDFDETIAVRTRPLDQLMAEGAALAAAYMRSTGMELADDIAHHIVEARRFGEEKSEEEQEEHLADDALSFLLQFVGYPISRMDADVLQRAVDLLFAPEMTAWALRPGAVAALQSLQAAGLQVALLANHSCDRVFQRTVDYLKIRPFFDVCLSSSSVEYRKPDIRFFELVLERWGALPHEVVVIGDSLKHDIAAGLELGALTVLAVGATSSQVELDNQLLAASVLPDAVIEELAQVPALVERWRD
jgi:HAD superfamily hydrolase (TIGR01509 family)